MKYFLPTLAILLSGCASVRPNPIFSLDFSAQPPRASIRGVCNGGTFTSQGTVVCEQKVPAADVLVVASELSYGSSGFDVKVLQNQLNALADAKLNVDGNFGAATLSAVKAFQAKAGLAQSGVATAVTLAKLNISISNANATIYVKIPPLQGRVIFSNGQLKQTSDFNWYPKEGFWFWQKQPIKDTWIPLDMGDLASTFGDWPVAFDVAAVDPDKGVVVTRGLMYYRVCNDKDVPCSRMVINYTCAGYNKFTEYQKIGKCERLAGSQQTFEIPLKTASYEVTPGAKIYIAATRMGISQTYTPYQADFAKGSYTVAVPALQPGPTMINFAMDWIDDKDQRQHVETRILMVAYDPNWTGLDKPHVMDGSRQMQFVKPVLSDIMEANLYQGRTLVAKEFSSKDTIVEIQKPSGSQIACAFAWQKDSSDQTVTCVDSNLNEVPLP